MISLVITARKRFEDKTGYAKEIKKEVDIYVRQKINEFKDCGMNETDVMVTALGSAVQIITQYSNIKSHSGNLSTKDILYSVQQITW
jgi:adenine-specific DNA methylase